VSRIQKITLSLSAPALTRGVGFFETVWVIDHRPVFFERHLRRMVSSCRALEVPAPLRSAVEVSLRATLSAARRGAEYVMRWSYLAVSEDLDKPRSWKFFSFLFPIPAEILRKRKGVRAVTLPSGWQRITPKWKTIDYRASVAGVRLARSRGADEAIFVDRRGRALEGTTSNVFSLSGPAGRTPPEKVGILPGVVRAWVLENASRVGLAIRETGVSVEALTRGGFLSASVTGLAPLISLNGRKCPPPDRAFRDLRELYLGEAAGNS
jgi:4-amino-4-deoxychorismate lyase